MPRRFGSLGSGNATCAVTDPTPVAPLRAKVATTVSVVPNAPRAVPCTTLPATRALDRNGPGTPLGASRISARPPLVWAISAEGRPRSLQKTTRVPSAASLPSSCSTRARRAGPPGDPLGEGTISSSTEAGCAASLRRTRSCRALAAPAVAWVRMRALRGKAPGKERSRMAMPPAVGDGPGATSPSELAKPTSVPSLTGPPSTSATSAPRTTGAPPASSQERR